MELTHLDLFSGIGGFSLASNRAGFKTVGFSEIDRFCDKVLKKNFPHVKNYGDIKSLNHEQPVTLITGGFPCQPFSVAGQKKGRNDDRYLWPEFFRIIQKIKPTWVVAENVAGIVEMELENILTDMEKEGYEVVSFIIPACAANAPHRRDRLWVVAHRDSKRCYEWQDSGEARYLQDNLQRNITALQSEWEKFKPESWATFNAKDWAGIFTDPDILSRGQANTGAITQPEERDARLGHSGQDRPDPPAPDREKDQPPIPGVDDGLPCGVDRNRALGNAIVPQVVFPILSLIREIEIG